MLVLSLLLGCKKKPAVESVPVVAPAPEPVVLPTFMIFYKGCVGQPLIIDDVEVGAIPKKVELEEGEHRFVVACELGDVDEVRTLVAHPKGETQPVHLGR